MSLKQVVQKSVKQKSRRNKGSIGAGEKHSEEEIRIATVIIIKKKKQAFKPLFSYDISRHSRIGHTSDTTTHLIHVRYGIEVPNIFKNKKYRILLGYGVDTAGSFFGLK